MSVRSSFQWTNISLLFFLFIDLHLKFCWLIYSLTSVRNLHSEHLVWVFCHFTCCLFGLFISEYICMCTSRFNWIHTTDGRKIWNDGDAACALSINSNHKSWVQFSMSYCRSVAHCQHFISVSEVDGLMHFTHSIEFSTFTKRNETEYVKLIDIAEHVLLRLHSWFHYSKAKRLTEK